MSVFSIILLIFGLSQLYWAWRGYTFARKRIRSRAALWTLCAAVVLLYLFLYQFNLGGARLREEHVYLTWQDALLAAPFRWWAASSLVAFLVVLLLAIPRGIVALVRLSPKKEIQSPGRRSFLEHAATAATAAPFVAGAYGLFYGRLNLETTVQTIHLPRLPRAFEGFRICQLSDIHIGPFMPDDEIRRYVAIANAQKAEMIVLTGDFVTFDPDTQQAVVDALRGLRAPFGVWGCLGNHDMWARVEDSITDLFRQANIRILRGAKVPIAMGGESFNLIGVDFQSPHRFGPSPAVSNLLGNIVELIDRDRVNILLSHNPDTFPARPRLASTSAWPATRTAARLLSSSSAPNWRPAAS